MHHAQPFAAALQRLRAELEAQNKEWSEVQRGLAALGEAAWLAIPSNVLDEIADACEVPVANSCTPNPIGVRA